MKRRKAICDMHSSHLYFLERGRGGRTEWCDQVVGCCFFTVFLVMCDMVGEGWYQRRGEGRVFVNVKGETGEGKRGRDLFGLVD